MFHKIEHYNTAKKIVDTAQNINFQGQIQNNFNILNENVQAFNQLANLNNNTNMEQQYDMDIAEITEQLNNYGDLMHRDNMNDE